MSQFSGWSKKDFTFAFLLSALFLTSCQSSTATRGAKDSAEQSAAQTAPSPVSKSPSVEILVDEAMLRKPYAILGGTLKNVGTEKLENLSLELELVRRADGSAERREVSIEPDELNPGGSGKYSIRVLSEEWRGSRIIRLQSSSKPGEIAFKTLPGARRPPEKITPVTRVINERRPRTHSKGEEFINTPDSAVAVP
jgi:hypothetical protein